MPAIKPTLQVPIFKTHESALPNQPANFYLIPVHTAIGRIDSRLAGT
jgi:hypothetical protein